MRFAYGAIVGRVLDMDLMMKTLRKIYLLNIGCVAFLVCNLKVQAQTSVVSQPLSPFGLNTQVTPKQVKAIVAAPQSINCLQPEKADEWEIANLPKGAAGKPFAITNKNGKNILEISTDGFARESNVKGGTTMMRLFLPGDSAGNGEVWDKNHGSFITFHCRSNKPAELSFRVLYRGKSLGGFRAPFKSGPGDWQLVRLSGKHFGIKNLANVAGIGFCVASADSGTKVEITDLGVDGVAFTNDLWKSHRLVIDLEGDWHFAADSGDRGLTDKWNTADFDDSSWKVLQTGKTWESQGVEHSGFGWYRQKIFVPKEMAGTALFLDLMENATEDDVWFNGVWVAGTRGEYQYRNRIPRVCSIPASNIHYGELNTIAIRLWGGSIAFGGKKSGMVKGAFKAELDPYRMMLAEPGGKEQPVECFDLSNAQNGKPFELVFRFPAEMLKDPATLRCNIKDFYGKDIGSVEVPLEADAKSLARGIVPVDFKMAQTIYFRGRFKTEISVTNSKNKLLYSDFREFDNLSFEGRDRKTLPVLAESIEETPYGKLTLVDEIDCSTPVTDELHPYLQSGFNENKQMRMTPGSAVNVNIVDILGKKARESEMGWFAYRIGRGKLKAHSTYLVRIEYPEDKPRYCPIEIQTGRTFVDAGWESGVSSGDAYAPWPLSGKWQWYDAIVPLDDRTLGSGGSEAASSENGFWIYFMNKVKPKMFYSMYDGGPAVARIKLYEINAETNSPVINLPKDLPQRVLMFDWERQVTAVPEDFVRYGKLMGYNAISPTILKWGTMNYGDPLNGYDSVNVDDKGYWVRNRYDPKAGEPAGVAIPSKKTVHAQFLEATKHYGMNYIPRFEYGGSNDLPEEARAINKEGTIAKPNRFATWGADLLQPATFKDLAKLMDSLIKPYAKDNPQLMGALWRIRSDRMQISYSRYDMDLFTKETGTTFPSGSDKEQAAWVATGDGRQKYDDWWLKKRAEFHGKLAALLTSYRPDMELYYYNWDGDKFSLVLGGITVWSFISQMEAAPGGNGRAVYEENRAERKKLTGKDYIDVMRTGNLTLKGTAKGVYRTDYAMRPELYRDIKGIELLAPANQIFYADAPDYLNYFKTAEGLAVSNAVPYDEIFARAINNKYECNEVTPGGSPFSMAYELLAYYHGDARSLTYTPYTYGRGFADAHRRFAQAFLALPAIEGNVVEGTDKDVKIRTYSEKNGIYAGVAYKGYVSKKITVKIPNAREGMKVKNLVTNEMVAAEFKGNALQFDLESGPMELNAYLIQ